MTAMERHATALAKTREWRVRVADQLDVTVEDLQPLGSPGYWHATASAPHPDAVDGDVAIDPVRASATGTSEAGARELAQIELFGLVTRMFVAADEPAARPYTHDLEGAKAVANLVMRLGGQRPRQRDVDAAQLAARVETRGPLLVGDVAAVVLERQRSPITDIDHPQQGRLPV